MMTLTSTYVGFDRNLWETSAISAFYILETNRIKEISGNWSICIPEIILKSSL